MSQEEGQSGDLSLDVINNSHRDVQLSTLRGESECTGEVSLEGVSAIQNPQ